MMLEIDEVRVTLDRNGNRVGFASCVLKSDDGYLLALDGIVIFQLGGRLAIAYPMRDKKRDISYWNPLNRQTAELIENAIFSEVTAIKHMKFD